MSYAPHGMPTRANSARICPKCVAAFAQNVNTSGLAVNWSTACAKAWMAGTSLAKTKQPSICSVMRPQDFPRTALRFRGGDDILLITRVSFQVRH
jgi:hypothetical protein